MTGKFQLGHVVITKRISDLMKKNFKFNALIQKCFRKYTRCMWGDMCQEDKNLNDEAILSGERIVGAYNTSQGKIYIITEWDRSYTTILFADEY